IELSYLHRASSRDVIKKLPMFQSAYSKWEDMPIPVIASIQGYCFGNATELILACDLRIASKNAAFAIQEVKVAGLAPDFGGTTRLPRLVGLGQAKRLIMTGEKINAEEAYRIGLVEYLAEENDLYQETMRLAVNLASQPPIGMMMAKKGLNLAFESSRMASMQFEQVQAMFCCQTEDQKESLAAILEKRAPVFKGK
ncbi:MAG: enoyl-CoA hydratase, partial [Clostridiales bacterium GWC2_40_7]